MNILYIEHYAGSPYHGMEYRPYYLAKEWVKAGHSVTIVAASFSHLRKRNVRLNENFFFEYIDGIRYLWIKTYSYEGNGIGRIINILQFVIKLSFLSLFIRSDDRYDAIIASSTYPLDNYPAYFIAKRHQAVFFYEVHDLWPLSPIELGGYSKYHPGIILMRFAEKFAYKHIDSLISLIPKAERYMMKHGLSRGKFHYIPNGIDISSWKLTIGSLKSGIRSTIFSLKKSGYFLVCYTGSHGIANGLDSFIEAGKLLKNEKIALILVGKGPEKKKLKKRAKGYKNIIFLDSIDRKGMPQLLSLMDVLYISLQNQPLFQYGISPNKIIDYMMAAKPIVQAIGSGNDIISEVDCGISIEPENQASIASAILKLYRMPEQTRKQLGENGKNYVMNYHDYRVLSKKFVNVMNSISAAKYRK